MWLYRTNNAARFEPEGHFGHLEVSDVVPRDEGDNFVTQLSFCPPGGGGEMHDHATESQLFLVVEGELSFDTGEDQFTLKKHEGVLFHPGEQHATLNETDSDAVAVVVTVQQER